MHKRESDRTLIALLATYGCATLVHFIHNAEFLADYPGLPSTWTRMGVYLTWLALTATGLVGWLVYSRLHRAFGLVLLAIYALMGLDSLAHYVVASPSAHSGSMHVTILLEVTMAAVVLLAVIRRAFSPSPTTAATE